MGMLDSGGGSSKQQQQQQQQRNYWLQGRRYGRGEGQLQGRDYCHLPALWRCGHQRRDQVGGLFVSEFMFDLCMVADSTAALLKRGATRTTTGMCR